MSVFEAARSKERAPVKIAEAWPAHTAWLILLGAQERLVACAARPDDVPWMFHLVPTLRHAKPIRSGGLNPELLLQLGVDLLILPASEVSHEKILRKLGLAVVSLGFSDFKGLLECLDMTASLLQTDFAVQRAKAYRQFLLGSLGDMREYGAGPRILHVASLSPLKIDGTHTIIDQWIRASGGCNAATVSGNHIDVTQEHILAWNPDIIILSATITETEYFSQQPIFSCLRAVRQGQIYHNPAGLFLWDRYGPEIVLQVQWLKQIIAIGQAHRMDLCDDVREFYHNFYGISLKQEEAGRILSALPPS
ncbi:ABC transporter substrate-binding protein [Saccharibacter sp. 17.LH.SD]|uniref:ABC transporter substrate-binding protein n=1 Tax=Saccharibacter sp. 17.LH.SD TaxID=2689393 RepID=UPI001F2FFD4D|nr:ABC transporter substrate-binding protein [Saccharibacter sp. 17.LH.SD]